MEKVIPLQNLTDVKSFLQDKFTMVVDHSRQRIDFRPLQIRQRCDEGLDLFMNGMLNHSTISSILIQRCLLVTWL